MSEFGAHFLLDTFFLSGDRTCGVSREGLCFLFFFFLLITVCSWSFVSDSILLK